MQCEAWTRVWVSVCEVSVKKGYEEQEGESEYECVWVEG